MKKITFRISRFKLGKIDPPSFHDYRLTVTEPMTVLDSLEKIRLEQDRTIMYRHSCHHSSCGTCAIIINGSEKLACTTKVWTLGSSTVVLEPLKGFERIGDLVVKLNSFYNDVAEEWTYLQPAKALGIDPLPLLGRSFTRFENCIECGSCVSACPVMHQNSDFIGPAGLSALHRESLKSPRRNEDILKLSAGKRGARMCKRALACSRVCPTAVYPAKHIADLKSDVNDRSDNLDKNKDKA
jgi:succinate dehydrogenase / fumarate reductase iron-sulfur subunit